MFLVQMSLDTKRAEIRKLEDQARQREEALRNSEHMLETDAARFEKFLKENDQQAVQAIKNAETETKLKQDKVHEIKKLTAQIAARGVPIVQKVLGRPYSARVDCRTVPATQRA